MAVQDCKDYMELVAPQATAKAAKVPVTQGVFNYFPRALLEVAKVSAFGATKHSVPLAEKGFLRPEYTEEMYEDAIGRHTLALAIEGEVNAADGDLYHRAQRAWNALASLERFLIRAEQE